MTLGVRGGLTVELGVDVLATGVALGLGVALEHPVLTLFLAVPDSAPHGALVLVEDTIEGHLQGLALGKRP
jgi:hypothetical protein